MADTRLLEVDYGISPAAGDTLVFDGTKWTPSPGALMVTFVHTRPSFASATSSAVIAANANRKTGSYVVNNNSDVFWLEIGAAAVNGQGIPLLPRQTYTFNTTQEIRAIQSSGASLDLDVYEAQ